MQIINYRAHNHKEITVVAIEKKIQSKRILITFEKIKIINILLINLNDLLIFSLDNIVLIFI